MTGFIKVLSGSTRTVATIKADSLQLLLIPSLQISHTLLICKKMLVNFFTRWGGGLGVVGGGSSALTQITVVETQVLDSRLC